MNIDYALLLAVLTGVCSVIMLLDWAWRRVSRVASEAVPGPVPSVGATGAAPPPGSFLARSWQVLVEYARSLFPVFLAVFFLRSFLVEPFRIPSASMLPTLQAGDFILVSKFNYGIRMPLLNTRIARSDQPERGDVIVFRYPVDPSISYIKRVVGLPGDRVTYLGKKLYINHELMNQTLLGEYTADNMEYRQQALLSQEALDHTSHEILLHPRMPTRDFEIEVPEDHYFVLGDNRDNSQDSRFWGFVPDRNLVGRAFLIWMNWNQGIAWSRIGKSL